MRKSLVDVELDGAPAAAMASVRACMVRQDAMPSADPAQAKVGGSAPERSECPVYCMTTVPGPGTSSPPDRAGP